MSALRRHGNGVHKPLALLKVIEHFVAIYLSALYVAYDKRAVVTKRTAEIAPARKNGAGDFPSKSTIENFS